MRDDEHDFPRPPTRCQCGEVASHVCQHGRWNSPFPGHSPVLPSVQVPLSAQVLNLGSQASYILSEYITGVDNTDLIGLNNGDLSHLTRLFSELSLDTAVLHTSPLAETFPQPPVAYGPSSYLDLATPSFPQAEPFSPPLSAPGPSSFSLFRGTTARDNQHLTALMRPGTATTNQYPSVQANAEHVISPSQETIEMPNPDTGAAGFDNGSDVENGEAEESDDARSTSHQQDGAQPHAGRAVAGSSSTQREA